MKCEKIREQVMEAVLGGPEAASSEAQEHLRTCLACAEQVAALQRTMALLDEWQAPEPSPYFNSKLWARLREQAAAQPTGFLGWLRRPVLAGAAALLIGLGVSLLEMGNFRHERDTVAINGEGALRNVGNSASPAVSDLQYLDKNADLFSDFDALDGQSATE